MKPVAQLAEHSAGKTKVKGLIPKETDAVCQMPKCKNEV